MMELNYQDMVIELISDNLYSSYSTDNVNHYDIVHSEQNDKQYESYAPKYGVILKDENNDIKKAAIIIGNAGGATSPHDTSAVMDDDKIIIAIGNGVLCIQVPTLDLIWKVTSENCYTCFQVFKVMGRFIIHCEGSIICIGKDGVTNWEFTGRDIFVTEDGIDDFKIEDDRIIVKDWEGNTYRLTFEGLEEKQL